MATKNNVQTETKEKYIISADGIRMTYSEWLEMRRSEMS